MQTQVIAIPGSKVQQLAEVLMQVAGNGAVGSFAAQAVAEEDKMCICMPADESCWHRMLSKLEGSLVLSWLRLSRREEYAVRRTRIHHSAADIFGSAESKLGRPTWKILIHHQVFNLKHRI